MGYNDNNPYYSPEGFGLEIVSCVDAGEAYEFDMVIVFRDVVTGELLIASDSGCSCPVPFEDMTREDMTPISGKGDVVEYVSDRYHWTAEDVADLVSGW